MKDASYKVEILLNKNCNYSCNYCYIKDNSNQKIIDYNFLKKQLLQIEEKYHITEIYVLGGEPTIYPEFQKFIEIINNTLGKVDIYIQTNLSFSIKFAKSLPSNVYFRGSLHFTENSNYLDIIKKLLKINKLKHLTIMYSYEAYKSYKHLYKQYMILFKILNISYNIEPIYLNNEDLNEFDNVIGKEYSEIFKWYPKLINYNFYKKTCNISKYEIVINLLTNKLHKCSTCCYKDIDMNLTDISDVCPINEYIRCPDYFSKENI